MQTGYMSWSTGRRWSDGSIHGIKNLPRQSFTREIKYKVTGPVEIKAEANCNIHGSKGPATKTISVR